MLLRNEVETVESSLIRLYTVHCKLESNMQNGDMRQQKEEGVDGQKKLGLLLFLLVTGR